MKTQLALVLALFLLLGCISGNQEFKSNEQCKEECLKTGYENGSCLLPSQAKDARINFGKCKIKDTPTCNNEDCKCYCFKIEPPEPPLQCMGGTECTNWCERGTDSIIDDSNGKSHRMWNASDAPCCCSETKHHSFNQINDVLKPKLGDIVIFNGTAKILKGFYLQPKEGEDYCLFLDKSQHIDEFREGKNMSIGGKVEGRTIDHGPCNDTKKQQCGKHLEYCIKVEKLELIKNLNS
ncbi:hypothetical protein K8R43_05765 [archaeon]|nr:hypothetical protein [archaeon]